jgi:hypothetical protein
MVEQRLNLSGMLTFTLRGGKPINLTREQVHVLKCLSSSGVITAHLGSTVPAATATLPIGHPRPCLVSVEVLCSYHVAELVGLRQSGPRCIPSGDAQMGRSYNSCLSHSVGWWQCAEMCKRAQYCTGNTSYFEKFNSE